MHCFYNTSIVTHKESRFAKHTIILYHEERSVVAPDSQLIYVMATSTVAIIPYSAAIVGSTIVTYPEESAASALS